MSVEEEASHPPAVRLEAVAAGDEPGPIAAHLATCPSCAAYVARMKSGAEAFRTAADPDAFTEAIRRRAEAAERAQAPSPGAERSTHGRGTAKAFWFVAPALAAAAAVLLWLRAPPQSAPAVVPSSPAVPSADVARFKGGLAVAVIRDRSGRQERLTGPVEVEAGDRIRIEIVVDREGAVTAGLLSDDGAWTLLQPPVTVTAGTHYSDLSARFDEAPAGAMLLVGPPEAVDRARKVRSYDGVVAWRVRSAPVK
jgi:hypothetical protein